MGSEACQRQEVEPRALLSFSEPSEEGRGQGRGPKSAAPQPLSRAAQGWLFWAVNPKSPLRALPGSVCTVPVVAVCPRSPLKRSSVKTRMNLSNIRLWSLSQCCPQNQMSPVSLWSCCSDQGEHHRHQGLFVPSLPPLDYPSPSSSLFPPYLLFP